MGDLLALALTDVQVLDAKAIQHSQIPDIPTFVFACLQCSFGINAECLLCHSWTT